MHEPAIFRFSPTSVFRWTLNASRQVFRAQDGVLLSFQTLAMRMLVIALNVSTGIISARSLGPEGRGELTALIIWPIVLSNLLTMGLPSAVTYNVRRFVELRSQLLMAALGMGTCLGLLASLVGVAIAPMWLGQYDAEVVLWARVFMLNAPISLLTYIAYAALEATGDIVMANRYRVAIPLATLGVLVVLLLTGTMNPLTAGAAYIVCGLPLVGMILRLKHNVGLDTASFAGASRRLLSYGFRSYGLDVQQTLATYIDQVVIVGMLAPGLLGIYVVAISMARMLSFVQLSVVAVLFPAAASRPLDEVVALTGRAARVAAVLCTLAALFVIVAGPLLLSLLYGSAFVGAAAVLRLLVTMVVVESITLILTQTFMAVGRPGVASFMQLSGLGLSVPLLLLFVPRYGLVGAGIAMLIAALTRFVLVLISYPLVLRVAPPSLLLNRSDVAAIRARLLQQLRPSTSYQHPADV